MQLSEALLLLEIDNLSSISHASIKKKYHKLALRNHPDKNGNTLQSKETFQRISEAYQVITREISKTDLQEVSDINLDSTTNCSKNTDYSEILTMFIGEFVKGKYNDYISTIIQDIVGGCKEITFTLFEKMNKEQSLSIYQFIIKYKYILHISEETIDKVKILFLKSLRKCKYIF